MMSARGLKRESMCQQSEGQLPPGLKEQLLKRELFEGVT